MIKKALIWKGKQLEHDSIGRTGILAVKTLSRLFAVSLLYTYTYIYSMCTSVGGGADGICLRDLEQSLSLRKWQRGSRRFLLERDVFRFTSCPISDVRVFRTRWHFGSSGYLFWNKTPLNSNSALLKSKQDICFPKKKLGNLCKSVSSATAAEWITVFFFPPLKKRVSQL